MPTKTYQLAIQYLARRDHSQQELTTKLKTKGCPEKEIAETLTQLVLSNLQSNARFAESYTTSRRQKGYGPLRIHQELQARGLDTETIAQVLDITDNKWFTDIMQVWKKKFRGKQPTDFQERAKQMRFLQYRGFTKEQIDSVFGGLDQDY